MKRILFVALGLSVLSHNAFALINWPLGQAELQALKVFKSKGHALDSIQHFGGIPGLTGWQFIVHYKENNQNCGFIAEVFHLSALPSFKISDSCSIPIQLIDQLLSRVTDPLFGFMADALVAFDQIHPIEKLKHANLRYTVGYRQSYSFKGDGCRGRFAYNVFSKTVDVKEKCSEEKAPNIKFSGEL